MCELTYYKHRHCGCTWVEISRPCQPYPGMFVTNMGFSSCPSFGNGDVKPEPEFLRTSGRLCPWHGMGGWFDRNQIRRVVRVRRGLRIGAGEDPDGVGCDVPCVVM